MYQQLDIFYHITTPISESEINREIVKAKSLQARVFEFFQRNPENKMIWSDVAERMGIPLEQHNSLKRSISNLVNKGSIEMLKKEPLEKSIFGGMSHKHIYRGC